MAEVVQHFMELMIPELQDLEEKGIFSNVCVGEASMALICFVG